MNNKPDRTAIEQATAAFLAQGGTITQCRAEESAEPVARPLTRSQNLARRKQRDWEEKNNARARRGHA